jgi:hypothetical protein
MKINKKEGISVLTLYNLPTIQKITPEEVFNNEYQFAEGLSVRLSPKGNESNAFLPSIHNCRDIARIREFIEQYSNKYSLFIHKTVKPELIGSASRLNTFNQSMIIMETFKNFDDRKRDIINNRMIVPVYGNRFMISDLELENKIPEDFKLFSKVLKELRKLPFSSYNTEYVIENGKIVFTELAVEESIYTKHDKELENVKGER